MKIETIKLANGLESKNFILKRDRLKISLLDYGASICSICAIDKNNNEHDILLGPPRLEDYGSAHPYFGSTIGRFSNRIQNAQFYIDGKLYKLSSNDGLHCLHGGANGFDKYLWKSSPETIRGNEAVVMTLTSPNLDQGFPANIDVEALFVLNENGLSIQYKAVTDFATPVSITNHAYFNLSNDSTIAKHDLLIFSDTMLKNDDDNIPLPIAPSNIRNTYFDFTHKKSLEAAIHNGGLDNCYILNNKGLVKAAELTAFDTGLSLCIYTDMPALQVYTGNFLSGIQGKGGVYKAHAGICFEPEYYPNSPNRPDFPSCILKPNTEYKHRIDYVLDYSR